MRNLLLSLITATTLHWAIPGAAADRTLVVLVPGGKGAPSPRGFLMRNKHQFDRAGFETKIASSPKATMQAARQGRKSGRTDNECSDLIRGKEFGLRGVFQVWQDITHTLGVWDDEQSQ